MIAKLEKFRIFSFGLFALIVGAPAQAASTECRTAALPDGTPAMFCKDKSGKWKQQAGEVVVSNAVAATTIPARAQATYRGTYSASVSARSRGSRSINLNNIINQAISQAMTSNARRVEGAMTFAMTFDGASVTADVSGTTGPMKPGRMTGLVRGGICRLTSANGAEDYEGKCSPSGFSGTIKSNSLSKESVSGTFEMQVVSFVDSSRRDAERAALKQACDAGKTTACVALYQN